MLVDCNLMLVPEFTLIQCRLFKHLDKTWSSFPPAIKYDFSFVLLKKDIAKTTHSQQAYKQQQKYTKCVCVCVPHVNRQHFELSFRISDPVRLDNNETHSKKQTERAIFDSHAIHFIVLFRSECLKLNLCAE